MYRLNDNYSVLFETPDDGYSYFFGYYDKTPLDETNSRLLAHRVSFDGRDVQTGDFADVGYFDLASGKFNVIDRTLAWNWQQGSHLQWLPSSNYSKVIYNNILDSQFVAIIYDLETKERNIVPFPIYVVHPNGQEALAVNYERLFWCRPGYNYQNIVENKWHVPFHKDDGIFRVDLNSGEKSLIVRTEDVVNIKAIPQFKSCDNWLEHMSYNPSGSRFVFFHRYNNGTQDVTRAFSANSTNGSELYSYPDVGFYSHCDWKSDNELSIWTIPPSVKGLGFPDKLLYVAKSNPIIRACFSRLYSLLKPVLPSKVKGVVPQPSKVLSFMDLNGKYQVVGDGKLIGNGHFTWFNDQVRMLNDTYQDENKYRHLYIYNTNTNTISEIGKFYSVYNNCTYRCDLHPRLSDDEKLVIIDSAHNLKRKILIVELT